MLRILKYAVSDEEWGLSGFLQFLKRALGEGRGVASLQCPSFTLSAVLKQHNRLLPLVQQGRGGGEYARVLAVHSFRGPETKRWNTKANPSLTEAPSSSISSFRHETRRPLGVHCRNTGTNNTSIGR